MKLKRKPVFLAVSAAAACAALALAQAQLAHAKVSYARQQGLVGRGATPQQTLDDARSSSTLLDDRRRAADCRDVHGAAVDFVRGQVVFRF
ncbi:MAG: hypothetical protein ACLPJJ_04380 [Acidocella sp.]|uniref:hypothetical protein n=1 Tax=Acidocella sp. TaxID=50710 RepID=UPI003FC87B33